MSQVPWREVEGHYSPRRKGAFCLRQMGFGILGIEYPWKKKAKRWDGVLGQSSGKGGKEKTGLKEQSWHVVVPLFFWFTIQFVHVVKQGYVVCQRHNPLSLVHIRLNQTQ